MIKACGVSLRYPDGTLALNNINLHIKPGELVYITGPSGSGKTSLLKLIMGIEYATEGSMALLGCPMSKGQEAKIRQLRKSVGPIFQEFRLVKGRTAIENVMQGMRFLNMSPTEMKEAAHSALARVGLEHKKQSLVENLSWGEGQRVAIARAVARKPVLILADEPTGNLDKENALNILELLTSFVDKKTAVVVTTHAVHLIEGRVDARYLQMEKGRILMERLGAE